MPRYLRCLPALALAISCAIAGAAEEPLLIELTQERVEVTAEGEKRSSAAAVSPGDTVEYTATYRNRGERTLAAVEATVPVPPGVTYVEGSADPQALAFSSDGRRFHPLNKRIAPSGTAPPVVRALRWAPRDLAAGATFAVRLRVVVDSR